MKYRISSTRLAVLGGCIALVGSATACGVSSADDDEFPSSQIEIIVPWDAGGGSDVSTRQLASLAEDTCGVRIIVSNRSGAAGATGHQAIADATPDGYTIGTATGEVAVLKYLGAADVSVENLRGIHQFSSNASVISVAAESPYETLDDLLAAMEGGDTVRVGTNGAGGTWDIAAAGLALETGLEFTERVPFDGGAPMAQALLSGEVEVITSSGAEVLGYVESGDFRVLAAMSEERLGILPDVPTLAEEGIDWQRANWFGIAAPAEIPEDRAKALSDCFGEAAASDEFLEFMEGQGFEVPLRPYDEFEQYMKDQYELNGELTEKIY